ncbi:hypothetical protein [Enterococcus asini]|uniref:hypothetical protein n=1 Tax=Enterococcus asini TaxID=57732 RepID=UPI00241FA663|nr:hypothetical protein [Enterococcus asini]
MIELSIIEMAVLELIPQGTAHKITTKELGMLVDLDQRSIFEVINSLRKKGVPVCAQRSGVPSDRGYYIATSEQERTEGLAAYKSQVTDMQALIDHIEGADVAGWMNKVKAV